MRRDKAALVRDAKAAARHANLRYVSRAEPGIRRRRRGKGFVYEDSAGRVIRDREKLSRIRALAIPPAWEKVWICATDNGHIQATGFDARGRKQYRYHSRWREVRDEAKYDDIVSFAKTLPRLRKRLEKDLAEPGLDKEKVIAAMVKIMQETCIRVGNERYAKENGSFGLTTLRDQHAKIKGDRVEFRFRAKGGKSRVAALSDKKLARIVARCRDIPGQTLFQYYDRNGQRRAITSTDVNAYIKSATGMPFTAKSFRTWTATTGALSLLARSEERRSRTRANRAIKQAIAEVAEGLGNTPTICKKCYVHPRALEAYLSGELSRTWSKSPPRCPGLSRDERRALALFERMLRTTQAFGGGAPNAN